ncbi:hypothetical protein Ahy_B04g072541 [Arachis hypogaea]|uniref:Aminotransferase-like plant mobile domain-containing protein n=1 Tax=Arachis hypogaea TaxID=3818 RepID=A0A444ZN60_ARAHY|nr:hypothetical protein Ahy_B04g072541 [Arachis hypogaea]
MQDTFTDRLEGTDEETVRRYARAYIMMLLSTQLFADKSNTRMHIRWLLYVARLEDMGRYSWGSTTLSWLYSCLCRVANKHMLGGLQHWPFPTLNIDFLMSKDGRGGDQWFLTSLQGWHIHCDRRAEHVLRFDIVPNPGPSHAYLEWWHQYGR